MRVAVGTSTITLYVDDENGNGVAATAATIAGTTHDGTAVSFSAVTPNSPTNGIHTATITCATPTFVTVVWTVDTKTYTQYVDVVGRAYVGVGEMKRYDASLSSRTADQIRAAIEQAEEEAVDMTGRSWVRRYDVWTAPVRNGRVALPWPDVVRIGKVIIDGTVVPPANCQLYPHAIYVPAIDGQVAEVGVEWGQLQPNERILRAVRVRARLHATDAGEDVPLYSERVTIGEFGTVTRMLPKLGQTGVAEVDEIYAANRYGGRNFA